MGEGVGYWDFLCSTSNDGILSKLLDGHIKSSRLTFL